MQNETFKAGDLVVGSLLILTGYILLSHFRKNPSSKPTQRIFSIIIIIIGFFLIFGNFFYNLAFK